MVGKSALGTINAFPLSTIRYAVAARLWLVVLAVVEGTALASPRGARAAAPLARQRIGFAAFNLLAYTGLAHARPESASLIVALSPLLTALVLWRRTRVRPATADARPARRRARRRGARDQRTATRPRSSTARSAGATCSSSAASSASCSTASAPRASATSRRSATRRSPPGSAGSCSRRRPRSRSRPGSSTCRRRASSPRSARRSPTSPSPARSSPSSPGTGRSGSSDRRTRSLFGNLIPVTTFAIEIARGYRPGAAALAGATVTVGALVANNLSPAARRGDRAAREKARARAPELEPAAAA